MAYREAMLKQEAIAKESEEDYKNALNGMAATPNGQFVLKQLIRYCGVFAHDDVLNPAKLVEDRGKRSVYLKLIRPYLDKQTLIELEN